jgi:hypothetical protein
MKVVGLSTWRRRVSRCALGAIGFFGLFAWATPALAGALQPVLAKAALSSAGVQTEPYSEVVSYNKGFAAVDVDHAGDILLFHKASSATSWTRTEVYNATDGGVRMAVPVLATSGKTFAIVANEVGTDYLVSWIGSLSGFTEQTVPDSASYEGFSPSIAYSPLGNNYVLTDTDISGNIGYWYSTTGSGGWEGQTIPSGSSTYVQSVITVTDVGVVIVATDYQEDLNAFYEPFGSSQWSMSGEQTVGMNQYLSITWSGSEVDLALQVSGGVYVQGYSDVGVPDGAFFEVYETPSHYVASYIAWSGSNAVVVFRDDQSGNLYFFYSNSNVTAFAQETIPTVPPLLNTGLFPTVVVGHNLVVVTDTGKAKLYAWLQPVGGTGWTQQLIGT